MDRAHWSPAEAPALGACSIADFVSGFALLEGVDADGGSREGVAVAELP